MVKEWHEARGSLCSRTAFEVGVCHAEEWSHIDHKKYKRRELFKQGLTCAYSENLSCKCYKYY